MENLPPRGETQRWLANVLYEGSPAECVATYAANGQRLRIMSDYYAFFEIHGCGGETSFMIRTIEPYTEAGLREQGLFKAAGTMVESESTPDRKVYKCVLLRKEDVLDRLLDDEPRRSA